MLPSKEELMTMPLTLLEKSLHPESPAEEAEIQKVLDMRREGILVQGNVYRNDAIAANIETPEQEAEWQKKIDARYAKLKPQMEVQEQTSDVPAEPEVELEPQESQEPQPELKVRFCEFCDSKGVRHKLNCTRSKNV